MKKSIKLSYKLYKNFCLLMGFILENFDFGIIY